MQQDVDEIRQIKEAAEADLLNRPGVTGVDVGYKYVGGQKTDEIVIRVHVAEKKDTPPDQKIPETIHGVKTDILQNRFEPAADTNAYNPLLGGISVGHLRAVDGLPGVGTLGAIVIDNSSHERMVLSNYHVLCVNEGWHDNLKTITQPSPGDNLFGTHIATLVQGILNEKVDAAVARLYASSAYLCEIQDIGPITGTAVAALGMAVRKRGRSTRLTYGTIDGLYLTIQVDYGHGVGNRTLKGQISISNDAKRNAQFLEPGDSGSVVVNDAGEVVGLIFALGTNGDGTIIGVANKIQDVLDNLNVKMALEGIGGYDLASPADRVFAFDYEGDGKLNDLVLYRPSEGAIFILQRNGTENDGTPKFQAVYRQGQGGKGIGGFDLGSPADRAFAFDYEGDGKLNDLVLYRPSEGAIFILQRNGFEQDKTTPKFQAVYQQGQGGKGIGGFDLGSPADRAFAFDYEGDGKLNDLVLYRPSEGAIFILQRNGFEQDKTTPKFQAVYQQGQGGKGIGGFDLGSPADRAFAFDYEGDGKLNDLVLYRPSEGAIFILQRNGFEQDKTTPKFQAVYQQGQGGKGIGGFDLGSPADRAFAFDYEGDGKLNDLVLYRPSEGAIFILQRNGFEQDKTTPKFQAVYQQGQGGKGIGDYDLGSPADRVFAFDYEGNSKLNDLVLYRPGKRIIWLLQRNGFEPNKTTPRFRAVYQGSTGR